MFGVFKGLDVQSELSARRDRSARRPRRTRIGLEGLEDRRVLSVLLASAAVAAHVPSSPI
jgi:hypothetical protein